MVARLTARPRHIRMALTPSAVASAKAVPPSVNLLPRAVAERRLRARMMRRWGWAFIAALVAVLALSGGSYALNVVAVQRLEAAQARTSEILVELAALQRVSGALATQAELSGFRAEAMAMDLRWTDMLDTVMRTLPDGVSLTGFDLTVGDAPGGTIASSSTDSIVGAAPAEEGETVADVGVAPGLTGALTLESETPIDVAPTVRALRQVGAVISADAREVVSETGGAGARTYVYQLSLTLDQSLYTGSYAAPGESESAR